MSATLQRRFRLLLNLYERAGLPAMDNNEDLATTTTSTNSFTDFTQRTASSRFVNTSRLHDVIILLASC